MGADPLLGPLSSLEGLGALKDVKAKNSAGKNIEKVRITLSLLHML